VTRFARTIRRFRSSASAACVVLALDGTGCHQPAPIDPLERAAFDGDVAQLTTLLQAGGGGADRFGALVWASRAGQVPAIALLLDSGADPNRHDQRLGWTPLMHALHKGQRAAASLLLSRGADPRIGAGGTSPVVMATLDNEAALVEAMLASKLPRDQRQQSLDAAVSGGALFDLDRPLFGHCRSDTVEVLLHDDPTLAVDRSGGFLTPLWWARRQGCERTVAEVERYLASH